MLESLRIHEGSGIPVWVQIRNHLVFLIQTGALKDGDILPTVRELAAELGVNYNTVHKVYRDLEADGLIISSRGKRSYVAEVDKDKLVLPESPVDIVIEELVKTAREANVSEDEVVSRLKRRFAGN